MPRWTIPSTVREFKKWLVYLDRAKASSRFTPAELKEISESKNLSRFLFDHVSGSEWGALRDEAHTKNIKLEALLNPRPRVENSRVQGGANAHEFGNPPALRNSGKSPRQLAGIEQKPSRDFASPGKLKGPTFVRNIKKGHLRDLRQRFAKESDEADRAFLAELGALKPTGPKGSKGILGLPLLGQEQLRQLDAQRQATGEQAYPPNAFTRTLGADPRKLRDLLISYGAGGLELPQTITDTVRAYGEGHPDPTKRREYPPTPIVDALAKLGGGLAGPARKRLDATVSPLDQFVAGLLIPGRLPKEAPRLRAAGKLSDKYLPRHIQRGIDEWANQQLVAKEGDVLERKAKEVSKRREQMQEVVSEPPREFPTAVEPTRRQDLESLLSLYRTNIDRNQQLLKRLQNEELTPKTKRRLGSTERQLGLYDSLISHTRDKLDNLKEP